MVSEVFPARSAFSPPVPQAGGAEPATAAAGRDDPDFQTFLRMLTAQARNQDPLQPMDSAEYAAQLAQFSMVEQQVRTNTILAALTDPAGDLNRVRMAQWVGAGITTTGDVRFSGAALRLSVDPVPGADGAVLVVRDATGTVLGRETVPPDARVLVWSGLDAEGNAHPAGSYRLSVEYRDGDRIIGERAAATRARVREARLEDGAIMLVLDDGRKVPAASVIAVREATAPDGATAGGTTAEPPGTATPGATDRHMAGQGVSEASGAAAPFPADFVRGPGR